VRIVRGGTDVGQYLCNHPLVETLHISQREQRDLDAALQGADAGAANDGLRRLGTRSKPRRLSLLSRAPCAGMSGMRRPIPPSTTLAARASATAGASRE
jgi:hypothetical protein